MLSLVSQRTSQYSSIIVSSDQFSFEQTVLLPSFYGPMQEILEVSSIVVLYSIVCVSYRTDTEMAIFSQCG